MPPWWGKQSAPSPASSHLNTSQMHHWVVHGYASGTDDGNEPRMVINLAGADLLRAKVRTFTTRVARESPGENVPNLTLLGQRPVSGSTTRTPSPSDRTSSKRLSKYRTSKSIGRQATFGMVPVDDPGVPIYSISVGGRGGARRRKSLRTATARRGRWAGPTAAA